MNMSRVSRGVRAVAGAVIGVVSVVAVASSASAAPAGPSAMAEQFCDPVSGVGFGLSGSLGTDTFTVYIGDMNVPEQTEVPVGETVYQMSDGELYHVKVVHEQTGDVLLDSYVAVACDEPFALVDTVCDEEGMHILVLLADNVEAAWWYVYVDDPTVIPHVNGINDTENQWVEVGVYPEGVHDIFLFAGSDSEGEFDLSIEGMLLECDDDGSGAGLPDSGSNTTPLMVAAGVFVLLGAALLLVRRPRIA